MCLFLIRWLCPVKKVESHRFRLSLLTALQLSMVVSLHAPLDNPLTRHCPHPVVGKSVRRFRLFNADFSFVSSAKFDSMFVCV